MRLETIAETYGMNAEYYDNMGGKIYHLTMASYDVCNDQTIVPVSEGGKMIGVTRMEGNYCGEHR